MDLQLAGHTAVVTGASKGIGLATARTLLGEGARVVAVSRSGSPGLDVLAGPSLVHLPADLADPDAADGLIDRAAEVFGGIDILVNNAGGPPPGARLPRFSLEGSTDADWLDVFGFNLFSLVRIVRAAVPAMLARGRGSIINVSSVSARQPGTMNLDYASAKAAVNTLTKALSEEFAPQGIRVNAVSPGPVRTAWWTEEGGAADIIAAGVGADRDAVLDTLAPEMMKLATGRLVAPQEVADVIALLASPRSASTTGADYVVDAGLLKEV
ncbi:SDR family NAD(P)-dependent oxidoreductase [Nocardiopsis sediminis]|uniref:SDR family NAD(P)-dependent oxidoreductase n=1 Tax=Nocardiopsis sediminis TaxID=1778267 RepID=A0ABV8FME9_9ACTN